MYITERFDDWLLHATEDAELQEELNLLKLRGDEGDEGDIADRFYRRLPLAEYGLSAPVGAGSNRINIYTIRMAIQALAYHHKRLQERRPVVIGYDSRPKSRLFATEAARVLAANGIFVWIFPAALPAPVLAASVPRLSCGAGVYITGGHLPWNYSGLRIYDPQGARMPKATAHALTRRMATLNPFEDILLTDYDTPAEIGLIRTAHPALQEQYSSGVLRQFPTPQQAGTALRVAYSPLYGTGDAFMHSLLEARGLKDTLVIPERLADGPPPDNQPLNPLSPQALKSGLRLCRAMDADLFLATDPACNRMGVAIKDGGAYHILSGHELGLLLLDHFCRLYSRGGKPPVPLYAARSLAACSLAQQVALAHGLPLYTLPPDFKAADQTLEPPPQIPKKAFTFAFDSAGGFILGSTVRDRDALAACAWVCDMAHAHKAAGHSLADAARQLYKQYGHYVNTHQRYGPGSIENAIHMQSALKTLRTRPYESIGGVPITSFIDYKRSRPSSGAAVPFRNDLLEYRLENGGRIVVHPTIDHSTIHVYIETNSHNPAAAQNLNRRLANSIHHLLCSSGELTDVTQSDGFPNRISTPPPADEFGTNRPTIRM
ncbi:MAG: hypothetical protein GXY32_00830 [Ruminococcaceae bacterium]|nr:hypothetical protein [Oscillospiraceae bacterium]